MVNQPSKTISLRLGKVQINFKYIYIGGSKGGRQGRAPPPGGPNSFIFMQFPGTKLKNNSTFGSWRPPWGKS